MNFLDFLLHHLLLYIYTFELISVISHLVIFFYIHLIMLLNCPLSVVRITILNDVWRGELECYVLN